MISPVPKPQRERLPRTRCPKCGKKLTAKAMLRHSRCGRPNRFGKRGKKTAAHGYTWDSGLERRLYEWLLECEGRGHVRGIHVKPRVLLTAASVACIPDFFVEHDGRFAGPAHYEAKGHAGDRWRIVRRLWAVYGPTPLVVIKDGGGGRLVEAEVIFPTGACHAAP